MVPFLAGLTKAADMSPARYSHGSLAQPWVRELPLSVMRRTGPARNWVRGRIWRCWMRWR